MRQAAKKRLIHVTFIADHCTISKCVMSYKDCIYLPFDHHMVELLNQSKIVKHDGQSALIAIVRLPLFPHRQRWARHSLSVKLRETAYSPSHPNLRVVSRLPIVLHPRGVEWASSATVLNMKWALLAGVK